MTICPKPCLFGRVSCFSQNNL